MAGGPCDQIEVCYGLSCHCPSDLLFLVLLLLQPPLTDCVVAAPMPSLAAPNIMKDLIMPHGDEGHAAFFAMLLGHHVGLLHWFTLPRHYITVGCNIKHENALCVCEINRSRRHTIEFIERK